MYAAHQRRVVIDRLEVDCKVEVRDKNASQHKCHVACGRPDDLVGEQSEWYHSLVALASLPEKETDEHCGCTDYEPNDNGAVPWVFVAAKLQAQQEHYDCRAYQGESWKVKGLDGCP